MRTIALQVHHIDENPGNNALENLIPLQSCHLRLKRRLVTSPYQHQQTEPFKDSSYSKAQVSFAASSCSTISTKQKTSEDFEQRESGQENH